MSDLRAVVRDHWNALVTEPKSSEWLTSMLPVETAGSPLLCAIDPKGEWHLLIPLPPGSKVRPDTRAAAVHLLPRSLQAGKQLVQYADLALLRSDLSEVFTGLCADVVAALAIGTPDTLGVISEVLDGWRELLRSSTQLGVEQLAGLFGELSVLNVLLDLRSDLLPSWRGPLGAPQDFIEGSCAIEVKATASSEGRSVRIHGLDQLDAPVDGRLMIWWMRLDTSSAAGTSVPQLVEATMARIGQARAFWQLLAGAGYYTADSDRYAGLRFEIVEEACYMVAQDFPRIVPSSFVSEPPGGVSHVRYTVDLQAAPPPMHQDDVSKFLRAMTKR